MHVVTLGNSLLSQGHEVVLMGRNTPAYSLCAEAVGFRGDFIAGFTDPFRGWKEPQLGIFIPGKRSFFARNIAAGIMRHAGNFDVVHYHGHYPMVGKYVPESLNFVQTRHDQGSDCLVHTRFKNGRICNEINPSACAGCVTPLPNRLQAVISTRAVSQYRRHTAEAFQRHPVVFVSKFLRDNAARGLGQRAMVLSAVVHNFCDEAALPEKLQAVHSSGRVLHVAGRLDAAKGVGPLLDYLSPRLPLDWRVNVFGDGPLGTEFRARYRSAQVVFHGHVPRSVVLASAASADAIVVPSVWEEPCGTVVLEALRVGRPCFALRRGGTPELARYGNPGQLHLFESMPELVDELLSVPLKVSTPSLGEEATALARMPELLALYSARIPDRAVS